MIRSVLLLALVQVCAAESLAAGDETTTKALHLPSPVTKNLTIEPERQSLGDGDNWPITWADDGDLYTAYCDGKGFGGGSGQGSMSLAKIIGSPPNIKGENIHSATGHKTGGGPEGRKASGLLMVDGVLYMWVRNLNKDGTGSSLAWSKDHAKTWAWADWSFPEIGYPVWMNAGRNYEAAQDKYAYLYSPDTPSAYKTSDHILLARVPKDKITRKDAYEFFAGLDEGGRPWWTARFQDRKPAFSDPGHCYRPEVVYNPDLNRYLLCTATSGSPRWCGTDEKYLGIFDAPTPWGPWTVVKQIKGWGGEENRFQPRIPAKWISKDGGSFWLLYSCFPMGPYQFNLERCTLKTQAVGQGSFRSSTAIRTVTLEETDEILANPGMGWETFHRTSKQDKHLPSWIPSTVHYARWGWRELEAKPGKIDHAFLDRILKETHNSGQKLAFRVMCCSTTRGEPYHPQWLKDLGGSELQSDQGWWTVYPIPDMDDPIVLERHLDFVKRLGERYDGHPDIDHVDLGSVGWWGEWHLCDSKNCKLPTLENRRKIVDAYLSAFRRTPLLMLVNGEECLAYATQHGTGWRADSLGDMGFLKKWSHMRNGYPTWIREAGVQEVWRIAPVAWETGGDMRHWVTVGWSLRYIFNYALALHGSYINNKSAPLPSGENVRPEIERFLRRLGYRLVLKELRHSSQVEAGGKLDLAMKWQNIGSAPCYRPYRLAYRLADGSGRGRVLASKITVNRWLPGSIEPFTEEFFRQPADLPPGEVNDVRDTVLVPSDLAPGDYSLSIAVVGEKNEEPVVRMGIRGRADDGWYPLSKVLVSRPSVKVRKSQGVRR